MTAPIKANTMRTNEAKEMLSARVSRVVKALIRAERRDGESDGEFIERLVLDNIETQEGRRIVSEYAGTNPLTRAVLALPKRLLAAVS